MQCPVCGTRSKKKIRKLGNEIACTCGYINKQFINTDTLIKQEDKWKTKD
jgi:hypothetical protein